MKQAIEQALANPVPESLAHVARQLHCGTASIRKYFSDLCRASVTSYRERFDTAFIERRLREVLDRASDVPAFSELAPELGYNPYTISDKCPELCKQVSARRHEERRRRREERMAGISEEIRLAASLLHEQGIYPSAR